ncbi:transposase [Streptomyces sp. NBC_01803]|uniref:transposase n=1 Tax=Streptomyces sp. NBC_01803 TaxID=2975946 RepID=UPI002DDB2C12|nr:transposase [Streptomyces sp. NBC_01803]WSA44646.1 transposase [Streptomyces sp. NBC_01803]
MPGPTGSGRPSARTKRRLIDGIRWRVRVGAPWRDVPDRYGSWRAVYALFRRWRPAGAGARIVTAPRTRRTRPDGSPGTSPRTQRSPGHTSTPPATPARPRCGGSPGGPSRAASRWRSAAGRPRVARSTPCRP